MNALAEIHDLIQRAIADLRAGWPEAAIDALGRAERLLAALSPEVVQ